MQIENFRVTNEERGRAVRLASFSVNIGPITLNGFDLIKGPRQTFVSAPHRISGQKDPRTNKFKRFSYVWFNKGEGEALSKQIEQMAMEEYKRRAGSTPQSSPSQQGSGFNFGGGGKDDEDSSFPF